MSRTTVASLGAVFAVAGAALTPAIGAGAEATFTKRLALPVAGDDIAHAQCVTADPRTGEAFVCDPRTNRILIFDREGDFDFQIVGGVEVVAPEDLAVDPDGLLLVIAARERRRMVVELDFDGLFRRELPLVGLPADVKAPDPVSVALSPGGERVYVADAANAMLWIADRDGLVLTGVDLRAQLDPEEREHVVLGHVDVYGDRALLALPMNGRILMFTLDGEPKGFVGAFGAAPCQLGHVAAAALDREGHVLALDTQRMVVSRWRIAGNRCLSEHIGLGDAEGYLYYPNDLSLDPRGWLFVSQSAKGRVQVYEGLGEAPPTP